MDILGQAACLGKIPMFAKLEPPKLKLLAFTSESLTFEDGEMIFHVGDPADCAYVILDGEAEILAEIEDSTVVVATLGRNQLFGELAVLNKTPRSATLRAKGNLEALRFTDEVFVKLATENPEVALDVMRQLSEKLALSLRQFEALQAQLQRYEGTVGQDAPTSP
jgi:CRP/FNR family transcriptional regulator, cyclic AMP receptor protein